MLLTRKQYKIVSIIFKIIMVQAIKNSIISSSYFSLLHIHHPEFPGHSPRNSYMLLTMKNQNQSF